MDPLALTVLLPPDVPLWAGLSLIVLSIATSFISAAFGLGGGIVLLAVMATLLPATVLVPIHGMVQIGSNAGRAFVMARDVRLGVMLPFLIAMAAGATAGGMIAVRLPEWLLQLALGCFILWSVWGRWEPRAAGRTLVLGGLVSGFLCMFIGATGPFVATLMRALGLGRMQLVATQAATMTLQHVMKVLVFGLLGFSYWDYLPLIVAMIVCGLLGTVVGRSVLHGMGDARFHKVLTIVLSLLALRLMWSGLSGLWA